MRLIESICVLPKPIKVALAAYIIMYYLLPQGLLRPVSIDYVDGKTFLVRYTPIQTFLSESLGYSFEPQAAYNTELRPVDSTAELCFDTGVALYEHLETNTLFWETPEALLNCIDEGTNYTAVYTWRFSFFGLPLHRIRYIDEDILRVEALQ